jgi:hypothetical protein
MYCDRAVGRIDTRQSARMCELCDDVFDNRCKKEDHVKKHHNEFWQVSGSDMKSIMAVMMKTMMTYMGTKNEAPKVTQLTKAKPPPIWAGEDFEKYEMEIEAWNLANKADDYEKYGDLLESLKKNKDKEQYVTNFIIGQTTKPEEKTVKNIMILLKDKYGRMKTEKLKGVLNEILEFQIDENETGEEYWDRFQKLLANIEKENVKEHLNYTMCVMMLEKAKTKGKVTNDEYVRMKEVIEESKTKGERVPKEDNAVVENLKEEFKKLKVENKRLTPNRKNEEIKDRKEEDIKVHYNEEERQIRWNNWQDLVKQNDYKDYKRSQSKPGF